MSRIVSPVENDEIFLIKSTDGGLTFSGPTNLSNNTSMSTYPQLDIFEMNVYVAWHDEGINGNNDIFFVKSTDNGDTFGKIINLSDNMVYSYQPDVASCENNTYVVWSNQITSTNSDIFFVKSTDNGDTFGKIINLSDNSGFSKAPKIAVSDSCDKVYAGWTDNINGNNEIFLQRIGEQKKE